MKLVVDPVIYARALQLSMDLGHHLFDTLYHAVALETAGATLVTADARYANRAASVGQLIPLARWRA